MVKLQENKKIIWIVKNELFFLIIKTKCNMVTNKKERQDNVKTILNKTLKSNFKDIFIINSLNKLVLFICLFLTILMLNFTFNKIWVFICIEFILLLMFFSLNTMLQNTKDSLKIFSLIYFSTLVIYITLLNVNNEATRVDFNIYTYFISISMLIGLLVISIILYYRASSELYKLLHFILCILNILILFIIILNYIGYGFLYYESIYNVNKGKMIFQSNNFKILFLNNISSALNNINNKIDYVGVENEGFGQIKYQEMLFALFSKGFVSTYIALVFAFISNSLFSRSGKDKN